MQTDPRDRSGRVFACAWLPGRGRRKCARSSVTGRRAHREDLCCRYPGRSTAPQQAARTASCSCMCDAIEVLQTASSTTDPVGLIIMRGASTGEVLPDPPHPLRPPRRTTARFRFGRPRRTMPVIRTSRLWPWARNSASMRWRGPDERKKDQCLIIRRCHCHRHRCTVAATGPGSPGKGKPRWCGNSIEVSPVAEQLTEFADGTRRRHLLPHYSLWSMVTRGFNHLLAA